MKKIAIAQISESKISKHFGRSPYFGIYTITNSEIQGHEMRKNTFTHHAQQGQGEGHMQESHEPDHNHNHNSVVQGLGDCQILIAGGMGMGAINSLSAAGIEVIITDEEDPQEALKKLNEGTLENLNISCDR